VSRRARVRGAGERGQATTEVVLLFPAFVFFLFAFAKVFALLILVQKLQIASFYAARRWQLESHRNVSWEAQFDNPALRPDITNRVCSYLGYTSGCGVPSPNFLDLTNQCHSTPTCPNSNAPGVSIQRTQVWNVVTTTVCTKPLNLPFYKVRNGFVFCDTKYVPNRDRPIAFVLPGLNNGP
jgi:hypothetical protein